VPRGPNHSVDPSRPRLHESAAGTGGSILGATTAGFLYGIDPGLPFLAAVGRFLVTAGALFLPALTRLNPARRALEVAASPCRLRCAFVTFVSRQEPCRVPVRPSQWDQHGSTIETDKR